MRSLRGDRSSRNHEIADAIARRSRRQTRVFLRALRECDAFVVIVLAGTTKSLARSHEDRENSQDFFVHFVNATPSW